MLNFTTIAKVPEHIIEKIGLDLRELLVDELNQFQALLNVSNGRINRIEELYTHVLQEYIKKQKISYDGYQLTHHQINDIARYLEMGHRVSAIKSFHDATGAAFADAKNFIFLFFGEGETAAIKFRRAFS